MNEAQITQALTLAFIPYNVGSRKNNSGRYIAVNCPYCGDSGFHGGVKKSTGAYNCFRCHTGGSLWTLVVNSVGKSTAISIFLEVGIFEKIKIDPIQAEKMSEEECLRNATGLPAVNVEADSTVPAESPVISVAESVPHLGVPTCAVPVHTNPDAVRYLLKERSVPLLRIKHMYETLGVVYIPHGQTDSAYPRWIQEALQGRILFPVVVDGVLQSWSARDTQSLPEGAASEFAKKLKQIRYLTPPSEMCVSPPQSTVYPYDFLKARRGRLLLIQEGVFDCLPFNMLFDTTGVASVALCTNNVSEAQIQLIARISRNYDHCVIFLDRWEELQSLKVLGTLRPYIPNLRGFVTPKEYKDTGDVPWEQIPSICEELWQYAIN